MDVQHLNVIFPQLQPCLAGFQMENHCGVLHEHGSGGLKQGVQGCVRRADVETATIYAQKIAALLGSGLNLFGEAAQCRNGTVEL